MPNAAPRCGLPQADCAKLANRSVFKVKKLSVCT
jgi:hypothetical protein